MAAMAASQSGRSLTVKTSSQRLIDASPTSPLAWTRPDKKFELADDLVDYRSGVTEEHMIRALNRNSGHVAAVVDQTVRSPFMKKVHDISYVIYNTFEDPNFSKVGRIVNIVSLICIVVSTVTFVMESVPEMKDNEAWNTIETIVVSFFTLEYVSRMICCPKFLSFLFKPLNVIDILAIMPFYLNIIMKSMESGGNDSLSNLRVLRSIRLLRVFRVFKLGKHSGHFQLIAKTLVMSADALMVLVFFIIITVIIFGGAIYYVEKASVDHETGLFYRQDGSVVVYDPFESIPAACWWAIVTFCTVGYGDSVPVTVLGKLIAAVAMLVGILIVALPVTIVGSNFTDVYAHDRASKELASKHAQTDTDFKQAHYITHIARLTERRRRLEQVFALVEYMVGEKRGREAELGIVDGEPTMVWNLAESTVFENVLHDIGTIEEFLLTLPCTTEMKRRAKAMSTKRQPTGGAVGSVTSTSKTEEEESVLDDDELTDAFTPGTNPPLDWPSNPPGKKGRTPTGQQSPQSKPTSYPAPMSPTTPVAGSEPDDIETDKNMSPSTRADLQTIVSPGRPFSHLGDSQFSS